ncbi:hypothetical protein DICPUDRAFT_92065 [Dictyostelium purpureum]|uniref:non-specific serine/threonine protein kinase n=1 Tax=Dictyostelium purpureum TaxID=5786 RepID=F0ZLH4_DICPU|nr:uncharacterized protein DICPUDRAFT_92065 [Dictyostelium purpureum]EGC35180.1 hypothetical protein DICPUDRAFT_92065 [Dictyostelium purpureum]|eukprot:XP_003288268.1 hypothetical protein DICPUDRAFT_92065 [Dictyostelium purpureum]
MEPILIPSQHNRLNIPTEPNEDEFNYKSDEFKGQLNIDSFEILSNIGSGSYGEVNLVKEKNSQEVYAMKKIFYVDVNDSELVKKRAFRERNAMVTCNNKNNKRAPKLFCSFVDSIEGVFYYVMEYIPGGDFNTFCYDRLVEGKKFTDEEIKFYIAELVCCLESFHSYGLLHRDVKPENILINKDGHLILGDFGSSKQAVNTTSSSGFSFSGSPSSAGSGSLGSRSFDNTPPNFSSFLRNPNNSYTSYIGTPQYMAVEVVQGVNYSKLCDYWSLGAILFELVTGTALFVESPDTTEQKIRENIGNWRGLLNTAIQKSQPNISKVAESLIRELISPERKRIDATGIKKHPFFEGIDWEGMLNLTVEPPFKPTIDKN